MLANTGFKERNRFLWRLVLSSRVLVIALFQLLLEALVSEMSAYTDSTKNEEGWIRTKVTGSIYAEIGGYGSLFAPHADIGFKFGPDTPVLSSVRLDVGATMLSVMTIPNFVPITIKATFFGDHALEVGTGLLLVYRKPDPVDGVYEWSGNRTHFTTTAGYRYEAYAGGFVFRANAGVFGDSGTGELFPTLLIAFGYAF